MARLQRRKGSETLLAQMAVPQVKPGPTIEVQKNLVAGLEANLKSTINADAKAKADHEALEAKHRDWEAWSGFGWNLIRGAEPQVPAYPFGAGKRQQVTDQTASEFNLGGILFREIPTTSHKDAEQLRQDLTGMAQFVPPSNAVRGSVSSGLAVPEIVAGLEDMLVHNTLATMIDAGQFKYFRAAGLPNRQWSIFVEIHYIRARPKDMAGFHKDTLGQTLFVNLNYHAGDHAVRGPEYVLNPPTSPEHDELIYGKPGQAGSLPGEFTRDLSHVRAHHPEPTEIGSAGTVSPYGYAAFVDEAIHHATPWFGNRYVTVGEFAAHLLRAHTNQWDAIKGQGGDPTAVDPLVIAPEDHAAWRRWWELATDAQAARRLTRLDFGDTMVGDQFDRMLEEVGARAGAGRAEGGSGGWHSAGIPNADPSRPGQKAVKSQLLSPVRAQAKPGERARPPLVRRASDAKLTQAWPQQLPDDVPRRFLRTWVRAVPASFGRS